jgi:hypothetical protein
MSEKSMTENARIGLGAGSPRVGTRPAGCGGGAEDSRLTAVVLVRPSARTPACGAGRAAPYQLQSAMLIPQYNMSHLIDRITKAGYAARCIPPG